MNEPEAAHDLSGETAANPPLEEALPERFELVAVLSRSETESRYQVRDRVTEQLCTLQQTKWLPAQVDPAAQTLALHDLQTIARLQHPHLLPIRHVELGRNGIFAATNSSNGGSLADQQFKIGRNFKTSARFIAQVARALHLAHQNGVLHGSLSSAHVFLDPQRRPLVGGFGAGDPGIARPDDRSAAPEQFAGEAPNVATDVYRLGALLYEMLTGHLIFATVASGDLAQHVRSNAPISPAEYDPAIADDLAKICLKALAKDPAERHPSALDLALDLENWLAKRPLSIRDSSFTEVFREWKSDRPLPAFFISAGSVLVVLLALGASVLLFRTAQELERTQIAERTLQREFCQASLRQMQTSLASLAAGRVQLGVDALRQAKKIQVNAELRSQAASLFASADLRITRRWQARTDADDLPFLFSPDFKLTFRAAKNGAFEVVSTEDQRLLGTISGGRNDAVTAIAPLPGTGHFLASRSASGTLRVWESIAPGGVVFETPGAPVADSNRLNFAINPVGLLAVGQEDGRIALHEIVLRGAPRFLSSGEKITRLAFDPAGNHLSVVRLDRAELEIIDADRESVVRMRHPAPITCVGWSHDSNQIALGSEDGQISIWDARRGVRTALFGSTFNAKPNQLLFSNSGTHLFSTGADAAIHLWDIVANQEVSRLANCGGLPVLRISGDDRKLYAADRSSTAYEIEVSLPTLCRTVASPDPLSQPGARGLDFSYDDELLAVADPAGVRVHDAKTGARLTENQPDTEGNKSWSMAFAPFSKSIYLKQLQGSLLRRPLQRVGNQVTLGEAETLQKPDGFEIGSFNLTGNLLGLIDRSQGVVQIFDPGVVKIRHRYPFPAAASLAFSPSGTQFVSTTGVSSQGKSGRVVICDLATGDKVREFAVDGGGPAGWSPDGKWITAIVGQGCRLWSANDWSVGPKLPKRAATAGTAFAWSPDAKFLAVAVDGGAEIYYNDDFIYLLTLNSPLPAEPIGQLAFSRDGRRLVMLGEAGSLHIWQLDQLQTVLAAEGLGFP